LDAQAIPPALEFIGEKHRTFHMMNIDDNEYRGQGGIYRGAISMPRRISHAIAQSAYTPVRCVPGA
jgi:hypothetical protein